MKFIRSITFGLAVVGLSLVAPASSGTVQAQTCIDDQCYWTCYHACLSRGEGAGYCAAACANETC
jgi:hypothetical protein